MRLALRPLDEGRIGFGDQLRGRLGHGRLGIVPEAPVKVDAAGILVRQFAHIRVDHMLDREVQRGVPAFQQPHRGVRRNDQGTLGQGAGKPGDKFHVRLSFINRHIHLAAQRGRNGERQRTFRHVAAELAQQFHLQRGRAARGQKDGNRPPLTHQLRAAGGGEGLHRDVIAEQRQGLIRCGGRDNKCRLELRDLVLHAAGVTGADQRNTVGQRRAILGAHRGARRQQAQHEDQRRNRG